MFLPVLAVVLSVAQISQNPDSGWLRAADLHFSAEDFSVKNAVPIPDGIWSLLKQDTGVRELLQNRNPPLGDPPRAWFSATVAHLHGASENDLVVQAEGELSGANVTDFWVFAETPHGPRQVLKTSGHDLVIRNLKSDGYKIIEARAVIAGHVSTLTYKFNGSQYILYRRASE
jgi:hypothetical protein